MQTPYREPTPARALKLERILVATDLTAGAEALVDVAAMLARGVGARVHVLHVLPALMYTPPEMQELARRDPATHPEATRKLADVVFRVRALGVEEVEGAIEFGIPDDVVAAIAEGFDLLMIGARGGRHFAARAVATTRVPILAVPL